jgi:hypothetical protein
MIKFFRKIRQNLLSEGKTGRYLKYAFGEIILVVIGILIALQINNWNDLNKKRRQEVEILNEIKNDLNESHSEIETVILNQKSHLNYGIKLVDYIKNSKPLNDSLPLLYTKNITDFGVIVKTSGFENLKNIGLSLVENNSLRKTITNLYQLEIPNIINNYNDLNIYKQGIINHYNYLELDYDRTRTETFKYANTLKINAWKIKNYQELLSDKEFMRTSQQILLIRSRKIEMLFELNNMISETINKINHQLEH